MDERTARALGASAAVGGVLAVVASVPSRWYGVPETDAYVFDPPMLTPLWVERAVIPVVAAVAAVMVVAGVAGLVLRDRSVAGRLRRWGGYAAVAGLAPFALVLVADAATGGSMLTGAGTTAGALTVLVVLLVSLISLAIGLPALVAFGAGYVRAGRTRVGYALVAGPTLSVLFFGGGWIADYAAVGSLPLVVPIAAAFVLVGHELWSRPDPLPGPGDDGTDVQEDVGGGPSGSPDAGGGTAGETDAEE